MSEEESFAARSRKWNLILQGFPIFNDSCDSLKI
jgi:hypothetical protein